jgi:anti-sigma factor RsiW
MMEKVRLVWLGELLQKLGLIKRPAIVCRDVVELVTNYLEGSLAGAERDRFEAHIGACPHCRRYLEQFQQTIAATGRLREDDIAPEAKDALLSAFRNWKTS